MKASEILTSKSNLALSTGAGAGVVADNEVYEKVPIYGEYITTHGIGVLSYAEIMKVIGTVYICMMIIVLLIKAFKTIRGFIHERREKKSKEAFRLRRSETKRQ